MRFEIAPNFYTAAGMGGSLRPRANALRCRACCTKLPEFLTGFSNKSNTPNTTPLLDVSTSKGTIGNGFLSFWRWNVADPTVFYWILIYEQR